MFRLSHRFLACAPIALAVTFFACSDDTNVVRQNFVDSEGIATVPAGERLVRADCNKSTIGNFVYVEDSLLIYHCTERGWRPYSGADGKQGKAGEAGDDGANGEDGENGLKGYDCSIDSYRDGFSVVCGTSLAKLAFANFMPDTCEISSVSEKGFKVKCGDTTVTQKAGVDGRAGYGCTMRDLGNGSYEFACPKDTAVVYAAQCGGKPYDPTKGYCVFDTVRTPEEYKKYKDCWEQSVDWSNHFCDTRDGKVYAFAEAGGQIWMAENLYYSEFYASPVLIHNSYCPLEERENGCRYSWAAAIDSIALARDPDNPTTCGDHAYENCHLPHVVRGICPEGWHLPNRNDFALLKGELLPCLKPDKCAEIFWTTDFSNNFAYCYSLFGTEWKEIDEPKFVFYSVRCIKDK